MCQKNDEILGLFPSLLPHHIGGIETSGRIAWSGIRRSAENHSHLFCYGPGDQPGVESSVETYASSKLEAVQKALRGVWSARTILIWHLGLLRLLPFFRLPAPACIVFLHGVEAWHRHDVWTRRLLRNTALFISNTDYTWQRFISLYPELNHAAHQTVHLGVGTPVDQPILGPADPPAALMLSRLHPQEDYKGHREMIAVWPLVLKQMPTAQLWIAGDGDLRPELEALAVSINLADHIRFFGPVSEEQKIDLLTRCRCLALPSRGEGFGLVYLEAMQMGRPCLTSTHDAGQEVVNPTEAGLAVDPDQARDLAEALIRLLTPGDEWTDWSMGASARYARHFTEDLFQQRLWSAISDHKEQNA